MCTLLSNCGSNLKSLASCLTPEAWLVVLASLIIALAGLLSLLGGVLTGSFLRNLNDTKFPLPKSDKPEDRTATPLAVIDVDLHLEHHQRGRCIVQAALILAAIVAIICSTVLELRDQPTSTVPPPTAEKTQ